MTSFKEKFTFFVLMFFSMVVEVLSRGNPFVPPNVTPLTERFPHLSLNRGFSELFGGSNIRAVNSGSSVTLILDKSSGSGIVSQQKYHYGFFSAAIKLPAGYSAGVVVAFYMSNADHFPHTHDEIDFELLGHEKRKEWVLQTNIYGNGSVSTGREERFRLWFDPTEQYHHYSIIWNEHHVVFMVDDIPVREVLHNKVISSVYPSKPMSVYATIWDGSQWATQGGKYPVDYKYSPFAASLGEMIMDGCIKSKKMKPALQCSKAGLSSLDPIEGEEFVKLSKQQIMGMQWARKRFMSYSYCKDAARYKVLPPECNV